MALLLSFALQGDCATKGPQGATTVTKTLNEQVLKVLPFRDKTDFDAAKKGFIASLPNNGVIKDSAGNVVWDLSQYAFIQEGKLAPDTVNPSLWRQAELLMNAGLYQVTERLYQVRGADIANMTIVEGETGIIVIDTLVSIETARAALNLYYQHRPKKPVKAVIFSHSHVDHFGGVLGVISAEDVTSGNVQIIAPNGFTEEALSENMLAGNVMARRAGYMYGNLIPKGPKGQITAGLGLTTSKGTVSFLLPTYVVDKPEEVVEIDGLTFEFMLAPNTEAPAEMHFYIRELKALSCAENAVHNMHNLYTLRGAKIRDAKSWVQYINKSRYKWGSDAEVLFGMHQWPVWGKDELNYHLMMTADVYKFIHDQTLHYANQGFTKDQIGERVILPNALQEYWSLRPYYGNANQNAKSVYEYYLGWFDGNPATLHPLPPVEAAKKYVEYMGGADAILKKAQDSFAKGEYRWVAEVLNHVVFADPNNQAAKDLEADALEQLGYQTETGPWRDFYLTGAQELRFGIVNKAKPSRKDASMLAAIPQEMLFDYMAIQLDAKKAENKNIVINWSFPDLNKEYVVTVQNSVLNYQEGMQDPDPSVSITMNCALLNQILLGQATFAGLVQAGEIKLQGDVQTLPQFFQLLDKFDFWFNVVTPNY